MFIAVYCTVCDETSAAMTIAVTIVTNIPTNKAHNKAETIPIFPFL